MIRRQLQQGPAVWRTSDVVADASWSIDLDARQRRQIIAAGRAAIERGATAETVTASDCMMPELRAVISHWIDELADRRGFLLLRGFPIDELAQLGEGAIELAYVALGTHLGTPVAQNSRGERLTHVRDERLPAAAGKVRLYRTRERQDFHTDAADIIGLLCLQRAVSGGESKLASSWAIYNELLQRRPDLLEALYEPVGWDRQGDAPDGERPWFLLAPLVDVAGAPRLFYLGWYIRESQQHPDAPRLTDRQLEAMEMLETLANDPTFHIEMDFRPGDVQLINNGRILHAREAYEDDPDPQRRRHLLRLWLAAHRFQSLERGLRTGIEPYAGSQS